MPNGTYYKSNCAGQDCPEGHIVHQCLYCYINSRATSDHFLLSTPLHLLAWPNLLQGTVHTSGQLKISLLPVLLLWTRKPHKLRLVAVQYHFWLADHYVAISTTLLIFRKFEGIVLFLWWHTVLNYISAIYNTVFVLGNVNCEKKKSQPQVICHGR
jgi:hypothetical protein